MIMATRPYTAVLVLGNASKAVNVSAPFDKEIAKVEIEKMHVPYRVAALIPGEHAKYTYVFSQTAANNTATKIDPFDMTHIDDSLS